MMSTTHRLIFIHTPKTGGNTIQTVLEPISDDHRTVDAYQDGIERFGLRGPITRDKHAFLAAYAMHVDVSAFIVAIGCRHPADRLVSGYFSPHRWYEEVDGRWVQKPPTWSTDAFVAFARDTVPAVDRLKIGATIRRPEHVIRYESLLPDLNVVLRRIGLDEVASLPVRNRTVAAAEQTAAARRDPAVAALAWERHREDFEFFGYTL